MPKRSLENALAAISPRIVPRPATWAGRLIHVGVTALWLLLFARAFFLHGVVAWATGITYVLYDTLLLFFVTIKAWPLATRMMSAHARVESTPQQQRMPQMGVIVAAHNEAAVLPVTVAALLEQVDGPAQIVIADDGSTDGTEALLTSRFGLTTPALGEMSAASTRYPNLYWLRLPHGGKARALNTAIDRITTETVMTVDADTLLATDANPRDARRVCAEPDAGRGHRHPGAGVQQVGQRPVFPVVPDLRIHAQLHLALCVDACGQPAAGVGRIRIVPARSAGCSGRFRRPVSG